MSTNPKTTINANPTLDPTTVNPITPDDFLYTRPLTDNLYFRPDRTVDWLWDQVIPLGSLTLIAGPPGLGKSLLSLDLAARLSTNAPLPTSPHITSAPPHPCTSASPSSDALPPLRPDALSSDDEPYSLLEASDSALSDLEDSTPPSSSSQPQHSVLSTQHFPH